MTREFEFANPDGKRIRVKGDTPLRGTDGTANRQPGLRILNELLA
jgi:hypothetical protein